MHLESVQASSAISIFSSEPELSCISFGVSVTPVLIVKGNSFPP